jgi:hypothetical protein
VVETSNFATDELASVELLLKNQLFFFVFHPRLASSPWHSAGSGRIALEV